MHLAGKKSDIIEGKRQEDKHETEENVQTMEANKAATARTQFWSSMSADFAMGMVGVEEMPKAIHR